MISEIKAIFSVHRRTLGQMGGFAWHSYPVIGVVEILALSWAEPL